MNNLASIITAFRSAKETIVFPIHPRNLHAIQAAQIRIPPNVRIIEPVGYLDMLMLQKNPRMIMTDSGGIKKEVYFFHLHCLTFRS